jgi:hypothetical protein
MFSLGSIKYLVSEMIFFICPAVVAILDFRWTKTKLFKKVKYHIAHLAVYWAVLYKTSCQSKKVVPYFCVLREGYYVIIWLIVVAILDFRWTKTKLFKKVKYHIFLQITCSSHVWFQKRF